MCVSSNALSELAQASKVLACESNVSGSGWVIIDEGGAAMNFEEAVEEQKEVMKRRNALGAIISVERIRDKLLTGMFKVGAVFGGGTFLFGLFVMQGRDDVSFPWVVVGGLVVFIGYVFMYIAGTTAVESLVDDEIRRRIREGGYASCWETLRDIDREKGQRNPSKAAAAARHPVA